jgi:hypothetical protein
MDRWMEEPAKSAWEIASHVKRASPVPSVAWMHRHAWLLFSAACLFSALWGCIDETRLL